MDYRIIIPATFIVLITFALLYISIIVPADTIKKGNPLHYPADYGNLVACINKAANNTQLKQCKEAVIFFNKRYKHTKHNVKGDTRQLLKLIDQRKQFLKTKNLTK